MEREPWHESDPRLENEPEGDTRSSIISDAQKAEREARTVQSIAEEMAEAGPSKSPRTHHYEAASHDLERADPELVEDLISATMAEIELRQKMGPVRYKLFKEVQSESLDRMAGQFKQRYRATLNAKDPIPSQRYDRIRTEVAQITRDMFKMVAQHIVADERIRNEFGHDKVLIKHALKATAERMIPFLDPIVDEELQK